MLALFAGAMIFLLARIDQSVTRVFPAFAASTRRIEVTTMGASITLSKTLADGTVLTATYQQQAGESYSDFTARVRVEWAALCAEFGR